MYAEEFVVAYERQIGEYKRLSAGDVHLKETVIMSESDLVTDPAVTDVAASNDEPDSTIDLNESAGLVMQELAALENPAIEQLDEGDNFKQTVAFEGTSLDDLPDEQPGRAEG